MSSFYVTATFPGDLVISQAGVPKSSVSTINETVLFANVHDPSNLLKAAHNVTYVWSRNNTIVANTTVPNLKMNFTQEGTYSVGVNFTALFNISSNATEINYKTKNGSFSANVIAKGS